MNRVFSGAAVAAACLMALACEGPVANPLQPTAISAGSRALEDGAVTATSTGNAIDGAPVISLAALPALVQVGTSRLVRTPNGINFNLSTSGLTAGHAYTLWFVVFNNPAGCLVAHECAPDDVVNPAAQPDMLFAAGTIAGGNGTATFAGRRQAGDGSGSINAPVGMPAYGLIDSYAAEVHLAVHDHGPRRPEYLPDMMQTVDGGCTDAGIPVAGASSPWNDATFGRRGPNTCATIQAAVHRP